MKLDLHVHSSYSKDGSASPRDIVKRCRSLGLDGLAITDHNEIRGCFGAVDAAKQEGLVLVRAVEVSTREGHILAYGVSELVPRDLTIGETVDRIRASGGIAVAAHPKRFPSGIGLERARAIDFDAIEVLNGGSSRKANRLARAVAEERHLPVTAGSDAHEIDQVGKAFTIVDEVSSEQDVIDCILRQKSTVGGRSRTKLEGAVYSLETLAEWFKGSFRRL